MSDFVSFEDFYKALTGFVPFRWQSRLADFIVENGRWPRDIGVPTGLGKSSTVELAVWALARSSALGERTIPTRIWYVVNRRLLVDEAHNRALRLQAALNSPDSEPVTAVAGALRALQAVPWSVGPLHVARLRGGADGGFRAPDPSCAAVIMATVPMFGSRLLFRGYGTGSKMRSIDAALAGTDSLLLLDEAHLARPLVKVLAQCSEVSAPTESIIDPHRRSVQLVSLTATGKSDPEFELDGEQGDLDDPLVRMRLAAEKPTELETAPDKKMHEHLAAAAIEIADRLLERDIVPAVCVFVNTARRAGRVRTHLDKLLKKWEPESQAVTLTGRLRGVDADHVRELLLNGEDSVASGRGQTLSRATFVVATQTLEVGADLDFDAMVSESAGVRALVQRFGRLNRLGERNHALGRIVHSEDRKIWPVYGTEPAEMWGRLMDQIGIDSEPVVQLGPQQIAMVLGEPADEPPPSPELLPNHVREWAKTSPRRGDRALGRLSDWDAPIDPFISGEEEDQRTVTVLWRDELPRRGAESHLRLRPLPDPKESVEVPVFEFAEFVGDQAFFKVEPDDGALTVMTANQLRPGATVVLGSEMGGYQGDSGWSGSDGGPVLDVSAELRKEFVVTDRVVEGLVADGVIQVDSEMFDELDGSIPADLAQAEWSGDSWVQVPEESGVEDARALLGELLTNVTLVRTRGGPLVGQLPIPNARHEPPRAELDDELSTLTLLEGPRAELGSHLALVGETARRIAEQVGLDPPVVESIGLAGRLHDIGKCDPRFQMLLGAEPDRLMAKSRPGQGSTARLWPRGARHEALSGRLVDAWLADNDPPPGVDLDLVRHLVLSHHGHGRPLVPGAYGYGSVPIQIEIEESVVSASADLADVDWAQPARFEALNNKYGPWMLALTEAVLRQADHAESALASDETVQVLEVR